MTRVIEGEKNSKTPPIAAWHTTGLEKACTTFDPITSQDFADENLKDPLWYLKPKSDLPPYHHGTPKPSQFVVWLSDIENTLERILNDSKHGRTRRGFDFFSRALALLPIPKASDPYWDAIPTEKIPSILNTFCSLIFKNLDYPEHGGSARQDFHNRVLLLHTCYAIADKLIRRISPELKGFSPPFILTHRVRQLQNDETRQHSPPVPPSPHREGKCTVGRNFCLFSERCSGAQKYPIWRAWI